jgi:aquaporin Z
MVNARFGGRAVSRDAQVVAPALMVMAIILFMGAVSGAHLNPAVSIAFALRGGAGQRGLDEPGPVARARPGA